MSLDRAVRAGLALLSGVLVGLAYPPLAWSGLIWIALVPLLWALARSRTPLETVCHAYLAGLVAFLLVLHPLASADAWTGWASRSPAELAAARIRQWVFLHGVWILLACWGALSWAGVALLLRGLRARQGLRLLAIAPWAWILVAEWLRSQTTWGFQRLFLGNAVADFTLVRQLAALGGVWLPGALVMMVNTGAVACLLREPHGWWRAPAAALAALAAALAWGIHHVASLPAPRPLRVALVQHDKPDPRAADYYGFGLSVRYYDLLRAALQGDPALLVLPESVAVSVLSLDGSRAPGRPDSAHSSLRSWDFALGQALAGRDGVLVMGLDTVEASAAHNSLVVWSATGAADWYHKRRLVPFAEYSPRFWGGWSISGASQYAPGERSGVLEAGRLVLGAFICQEVLYPSVIREVVREGATLLVSSGNDGVFANPAVAQTHAQLARLRAVEAGRYLVRAMKTGTSAIIDPTGRELRRSASSATEILEAEVAPLTHRTPYVRFGDWPLALAGAVLLAAIPSRGSPKTV